MLHISYNIDTHNLSDMYSYVLSFQACGLRTSDLNIKQISHAYVALLGMVLVTKN